MANSYETNRQAVTAAEAVQELFARLPQSDKDIVWLADELIGIVQHIGAVSLEVERDGNGIAWLVCRSQPTDPDLKIDGRGPLRLFRPLLARLAVLCSEESGTEFQPYGGRYGLTRSSRTGPVRLDVEFTNTPATQRLTISRAMLPLTRPLGTSSNIGSPDNSPQTAD